MGSFDEEFCWGFGGVVRLLGPFSRRVAKRSSDVCFNAFGLTTCTFEGTFASLLLRPSTSSRTRPSARIARTDPAASPARMSLGPGVPKIPSSQAGLDERTMVSGGRCPLERSVLCRKGVLGDASGELEIVQSVVKRTRLLVVEGVEGLLDEGGGGICGRWRAGRRGEVCVGGVGGGLVCLTGLVGWSCVVFVVLTY